MARNRLRRRYGHVRLSDPSLKYMVRFVHKISPSDKDVAGPITLNSVSLASGDRRILASALRDLRFNMGHFGNGLGGAKSVRSFRVEADGKVVVFPSNPTIWHAIIFTPVGLA